MLLNVQEEIEFCIDRLQNLQRALAHMIKLTHVFNLHPGKDQ